MEVLRGPAFGISDTELYEISLQDGAGFWDKVRNYQSRTLSISETRNRHLKKSTARIAHRMPVNQLIGTIVNQTGMIGTLKTGIYKDIQRWANYQKLLDLARNFDGDESRQIAFGFH